MEHGVSVHPYLTEKYGIQSGDQILEVDGETLTNLDELNKVIMLRDLSILKVKHSDGQIESINIPEDVGLELFQNNAFPAFGMRTSSSYVESVQQGSNAENAGLLSQDQIIKIDEKDISYFDDIQGALYAKKDKKVRLTVLRPVAKSTKDTVLLDADVNELGTIGFSVGISTVEDSSAVETVSYSLLNSITEGTQYGLNTLGDYVSQFKFIFTKKRCGLYWRICYNW